MIDPPTALLEDRGGSILLEAQKLTHGDRNADYGHPLDDYTKNAGMVSALLKHKLKEPLSASDMALIMVCVKLSRQVHRPKRDNMVDAAGYAWVAQACAEETERRKSKPEKPLTFRDFPILLCGDGVSEALTETYYKAAEQVSGVDKVLAGDGRQYSPAIEAEIRRNNREINRAAWAQGQTAARSGLSVSGSTLPQCGQTPAQGRACEQTQQTRYAPSVPGYAGDPP